MNDLRQLRQAAGLTQIELADRARVERTRISLAECGYVRLNESDELAVRRALMDAIRDRAALLQGVLTAAQVVSARA